MKRFLLLVVILVYVFFDFIFSDYTISDFKFQREKIDNLRMRTEAFIENEDSLFLSQKDYLINSCQSYFKYRPQPSNAYEKTLISSYAKKCVLLSILRKAKLHTKSLVDGCDLLRLSIWSSQLALQESCTKPSKEESARINNLIGKYPSLKDLSTQKLITVNIFNQNEILVTRHIDNKVLHIQSLIEADLTYNSYADILLQIDIFDKNSDNIECTLYSVYSKYAKDTLVNKKIIPKIGGRGKHM